MFLNIAVLETAKIKICIYSFLILPNKYIIKITFYPYFINTVTIVSKMQEAHVCLNSVNFMSYSHFAQGKSWLMNVAPPLPWNKDRARKSLVSLILCSSAIVQQSLFVGDRGVFFLKCMDYVDTPVLGGLKIPFQCIYFIVFR